MGEKMSALERILTVLEGKIPDKVPSFCLGGDFDFVEKFMNSPYALTDEDMKQLDKDKISYSPPFMHAIIAKFSPPEILSGGLDAKIDLCWRTIGTGLPPYKYPVLVMVLSNETSGKAGNREGKGEGR